MSSLPEKNLFIDIKSIIDEGKQTVSLTVNATLTATYWNIGHRILKDFLDNKRADYGKEVLKKLSTSLTNEYGKGWSDKQLRHCLRFAEVFPDKQIVSALRRQLSWTYFKTIKSY